MPTVTFLPMGLSVEVKEGKTILQAAVDNHIDLPHACGGNCSCTTCHVIVRQGEENLSEIEEEEDNRLDMAAGLTIHSRLGCQPRICGDVIVEVPKFSSHYARES